MTRDPQGGIQQAELSDEIALDPITSRPADWYDRSSLPGDCMVMIADQTEDEYLRRCPEDTFCEFINGVVYMHPAVEKQHQFGVQILLVLLKFFCQVRMAGIVMTGPSALRIRPDCYLEPDIFVMPNEAGEQDDPIFWHPPALFVVEVLSRTTRAHDLRDKAAIYREGMAGEVWFIDHHNRTVTIQRPSATGVEFREVKSGPIRATSLPGFWSDVDWLWAEPRPNLMRCLDQILAGPPPE